MIYWVYPLPHTSSLFTVTDRLQFAELDSSEHLSYFSDGPELAETPSEVFTYVVLLFDSTTTTYTTFTLLLLSAGQNDYGM